jgi:hypothetical protein
MQIKYINLEEVEQIGDKFLFRNRSLQEINLPNVSEVGVYFMLSCDETLREINLPKLSEYGTGFLRCCTNKKAYEIRRRILFNS